MQCFPLSFMWRRKPHGTAHSEVRGCSHRTLQWGFPGARLWQAVGVIRALGSKRTPFILPTEFQILADRRPPPPPFRKGLVGTPRGAHGDRSVERRGNPLQTGARPNTLPVCENEGPQGGMGRWVRRCPTEKADRKGPS